MASLNVLQPAPPGGKIRPSKNSRWRALVLVAVHLVIAGHITHWLVTGSSVTPVEPSEAMEFSRAGIVNAGLIFFAVTALLTAIFGRFFCGWACHLVALQDVSSGLLARVGIRPRPLRSRVLVWIPAIAFVYMFIAPAVLRWWRERSLGVTHVELTTSHFWQTFPGWFVGGLTFVVCGFVVVYLLGAKGFCTYACPYGALFATADRIAPFRIRVNDDCESCGHCTAVCTSNVRVHEEVRDYGMVVDPGCMKCMDCVSVCPKDALSYSFGRLPIGAKPRTETGAASPRPRVLPWREEAVLLVGFLIGYGCFRSLHGWVPFLLSLGLGVSMAGYFLILFRLWSRQGYAVRRRQLKRDGKLLPAGRIVVACTGLFALVLLYCAWAQFEYRSMQSSFATIHPTARAAIPMSNVAPELSEEGREQATAVIESTERLERFGIVRSLGAHSAAAWSHYLLGDAEAAGSFAESAIERRERPNEMHHLLGRLALTRGDLDAAARAYAEITRADGGDVHGWLNLSKTFAESGRLESAAMTLDSARRIHRASPELLHTEALIAMRRGRAAEARDLLQRALEANPRHRPSIESLAGVLASAGELEQAAEQFARALELAPNDPETLFLAARADLALGRTEQARTKLERVLAIAPGASDSVRRLLAQIE